MKPFVSSPIGVTLPDHNLVSLHLVSATSESKIWMVVWSEW